MHRQHLSGIELIDQIEELGGIKNLERHTRRCQLQHLPMAHLDHESLKEMHHAHGAVIESSKVELVVGMNTAGISVGVHALKLRIVLLGGLAL